MMLVHGDPESACGCLGLFTVIYCVQTSFPGKRGSRIGAAERDTKNRMRGVNNA